MSREYNLSLINKILPVKTIIEENKKNDISIIVIKFYDREFTKLRLNEVIDILYVEFDLYRNEVIEVFIDFVERINKESNGICKPDLRNDIEIVLYNTLDIEEDFLTIVRNLGIMTTELYDRYVKGVLDECNKIG